MNSQKLIDHIERLLPYLIGVIFLVIVAEVLLIVLELLMLLAESQ